MDEKTILDILQSRSREIEELRNHIPLVAEFLALLNSVNALPEVSQPVPGQSQSLYQTISKGLAMPALEQHLASFFGPPVKPAGQRTPLKLRFNPSARFLNGVQTGQTLFVRKLKFGEFYGALWPWQRKKETVTIHLGFSSTSMDDADYAILELLTRRSLAKNIFRQINNTIGGRIHGVTLPSFLQMAEMEKTTGTLKIQTEKNKGYLYLANGRLIDAVEGNRQGTAAAHAIISWEKPLIEIDPVCRKTRDRIAQPLMPLLMEGLRIKDENRVQRRNLPPADVARPPQPKIRRSAAPPAAPPGSPAPVPPQPAAVKQTKPAKAVSRGVQILAALAIVGLLGWKFVFLPRQGQLEYRRVLADVEIQPTLEEKVILLQYYINTHLQGPYTPEARHLLASTRALIEERDFDNTLLDVKLLAADDFVRKATDIYMRFLTRYPASSRRAEIEKQISRLPGIAETVDYLALARLKHNAPDERIRAYRHFIQRYPAGNHRQEVEKWIDDITEKDYRQLLKEVGEDKAAEKWDNGILRCKNFLLNSSEHPHTDDIRQMMHRLSDEKDLAMLKKQTAQAENDPRRLQQLYAAYLAQHPLSPEKKAIETRLVQVTEALERDKNWQETKTYCQNRRNALDARINRLKQYLRRNTGAPYTADASNMLDRLSAEHRSRQQQARAQQQKKAWQQQLQARLARGQEKQQTLEKNVIARLKNCGNRFRPNHDGTVTDTGTGNMWCVLDSHLLTGGHCMTYEAALAYVDCLRTAGYTDWRLPSPEELAELYKRRPYYPSSGAPWYWTAAVSPASWNVNNPVIVFFPDAKTVYKKDAVDRGRCGAIHAVRP